MQVGGYIGDDIEPDSQTRIGLRMRYLTKLGFIGFIAIVLTGLCRWRHHECHADS